MTKTKAALIHLALCIAVAVSLYVAITAIWYPSPLFEAVGGLQIFLLVLACDVIIGPLLTLLVYKQGKKSLKFDLSVIALLQLSALGFGLLTLWNGRPVYIASLGHRFDVVQASELTETALAEMPGSLPKWGPKWVGIKRPVDRKEREDAMFRALFGGGDYGHIPKYHAPLEAMKEELIQRGETIADLKGFNPGREKEIDAWLVSAGVKSEEVKFQLLKARAKDMAVIYDTSGKIVGIAPFMASSATNAKGQ